MQQEIHEALVATSSASAILWTGVLIVAQIAGERGSPPPPDIQSAPNPPWIFRPLLALPDRPRVTALRSVSEIRSLNALVMLGFGIVGPIFALFLSGNGLRLAAAAFALYYARDTFLSAQLFIRLVRGRDMISQAIDDREEYRRALNQYLALTAIQYAIMLTIIAAPKTELVLYFSVAMLFLGYQITLGRYMELRRPFVP